MLVWEQLARARRAGAPLIELLAFTLGFLTSVKWQVDIGRNWAHPWFWIKLLKITAFSTYTV